MFPWKVLLRNRDIPVQLSSICDQTFFSITSWSKWFWDEQRSVSDDSPEPVHLQAHEKDDGGINEKSKLFIFLEIEQL